MDGRKDNNVIFHLSDLHFTGNNSISAKRCLEELISLIKNIEDDWKPNILCITGDISHKSSRSGYGKAQIWLEHLLLEIGIEKKNVIICPGNHDVDLKIANKLGYPGSTEKADNTFAECTVPKSYIDKFNNYLEFCEKLGIEKNDTGSGYSYLFGLRKIQNLIFVVCNSCWFYRLRNKIILSLLKLDGQKEPLWIGLPLLEYLIKERDFENLKIENRLLALLHHPKERFHEEEYRRYPNNSRQPTLLLLEDKVEMLLCGDSHTSPIKDHPYVHCSALNGAPLGRSTFNLIKIESIFYSLRAYIFDPTRVDNRWQIDGKEQEHLFKDSEQKIIHDKKSDSKISTDHSSIGGKLKNKYGSSPF